jgi:glycosyltransferase involved in cell wall biosynthesis
VANSYLPNNGKTDFSIISISKNDLNGLRNTVNSLFLQDYSNWELIVVLSGGSDESLEYCKSLTLDDSRIKLSIQRGVGIYDAMNQGIELVTGKYLWFMNSGDCFFDNQTLREVVGVMDTGNFDILVGGYQLRNEGDKSYNFRNMALSPRRFSLNIRSGCHQSTIFKVQDSQKIQNFRTDIVIASDFDWILRQLRSGTGHRIQRTLATIEPGGISDLGIGQVIKEKQSVREEVFGKNSLDANLGKLWTIGVLTKINLRKSLGRLEAIIRDI